MRTADDAPSLGRWFEPLWRLHRSRGRMSYAIFGSLVRTRRRLRRQGRELVQPTRRAEQLGGDRRADERLAM